jgi:hypothetical protein
MAEEGEPEEAAKKKSKVDSYVDSTVNFFFSKDPRKWLILIVFLGALLRFLVASNISALGDEMVHGPHIMGFIQSGLISTILHSPLWFYLGDLFVSIFGISMFSLRFTSFFYGTLSIIAVYLIASKVFHKKIALYSSFLLAVSFFTIRYTLMEMDLSALFFLLFAIYFFIQSLERSRFPLMAAVCIGVAALIKTLALFFVPAFLIGFFLFRPGKENIRKNIRDLVVFGLIILVFFSPIIMHNYFWYKDKGMVDTYVAQYFDVGNVREAYKDQLGYDSGFLLSTFFKGIPTMARIIFNYDPLISSLGILGLILAFSKKHKRKYWWFLISFEVAGFLFLVLSNWLHTHYATMIPILCLFGGFFIHKFSKIFSKKIPRKYILPTMIIFILVFQLYLLFPHLTSSCGMCQARDYISDNFEKEAIVIADARIYRGRIAFLFNEFHYLESSLFEDILKLNEQLPGENVATDAYFVECARDDCGWGTVSAGQLNDSSEHLVQQIASQFQAEAVFYGGGGYDEEAGEPYLKIYKIKLALNPQITSAIDSTHEWFYYPVNYEPREKIFDNYYVYGAADKILYDLMKGIILISALLSLLLPLYLLMRLKKN